MVVQALATSMASMFTPAAELLVLLTRCEGKFVEERGRTYSRTLFLEPRFGPFGPNGLPGRITNHCDPWIILKTSHFVWLTGLPGRSNFVFCSISDRKRQNFSSGAVGSQNSSIGFPFPPLLQLLQL